MKQTTEKRHRTVAFRVWTGHKPAAAQAWLCNNSLTSHSSRTGISFGQLAFRVAPLVRQGGEFFSPLQWNVTPISRARWMKEKEVVSHWGEIGFASQDSKDCSNGLSLPVGGIRHEMASRLCFWLTHKPTEFTVQVFALYE